MSASPASGSAPPQPAWQITSSHRYYLHEDVVFFVCVGTLDRLSTQHMLEAVEQVQTARGRVFLIIDASSAQPQRPEARQYALDWHRTHRTRGCAVIFGANVLVRAGVALVNAATRLLVRRDVVAEHFVASESEAWELVGVEREKLLTSAPPAS